MKYLSGFYDADQHGLLSPEYDDLFPYVAFELTREQIERLPNDFDLKLINFDGQKFIKIKDYNGNDTEKYIAYIALVKK